MRARKRPLLRKTQPYNHTYRRPPPLSCRRGALSQKRVARCQPRPQDTAPAASPAPVLCSHVSGQRAESGATDWHNDCDSRSLLLLLPAVPRSTSAIARTSLPPQAAAFSISLVQGSRRNKEEFDPISDGVCSKYGCRCVPTLCAFLLPSAACLVASACIAE